MSSHRDIARYFLTIYLKVYAVQDTYSKAVPGSVDTERVFDRRLKWQLRE